MHGIGERMLRNVVQTLFLLEKLREINTDMWY